MSIIKTNGYVVDQLEGLNNKYVIANGYLGVTGVMDELKQVDGAHLKVDDVIKTDRFGKRYISVFNPLYTQVIANGVTLHPNNILPVAHEQSIDLDFGIFSRTTLYKVGDVEIKIYSERFLDQKNRAFLYSKYKVYVNKAIDIEIIHGFDLDTIDIFEGSFIEFNADNNDFISVEAKIKTNEKPLYMVYAHNRNFRHKNRNQVIKFQESYMLRAEPERDYEIIKYIGVSTDGRKNLEYLKKHLNRVKKDGYDKVYDDNKLNWQKLWKNVRVEIFNNDLVDRYNQFNQYQLIANRPISDKSLISRYGLTNLPIEYAYTNELYMFRYYLNTDYKSAKRMLSSRINHLEEALESAKKFHKQGAFYTDYKNNLYINALIVINMVDYIDRTLDKSILDYGGLEMVLEISKFYMDYIVLNKKKTNYQVLNVTTIDNLITEIDNDAFLNYLIRDCFGKTANLVALAKVDKRKEVEEFLKKRKYDVLINEIREARRKLYLQQPNVNHLIQIFDNYFKNEEKLINPDVLNLFFLYPDDFKELIKKANYDYYSNLSNPDAMGQFILSLVASAQELEKEANKYFKAYLPLNISDNANKMNHLQDYVDLGLSAAIYLYLVYGLAGLRHNKYLLTADSFIPSDIRRLEFKVKIASNYACVKIKRNSANIDWNE
jgi:trehalose/maltose hydrolase-like predicted phosphorylase